jgi:hypothetical protein
MLFNGIFRNCRVMHRAIINAHTPKIKEVYEDIIDFLGDIKHEIYVRYRAVKLGFKNLYRWFPIVWNDRQWDNSYMITILQHKLKQMEEFYRSDDCHNADWEDVANEIQEVRKHFDMIYNEDYYNEKMWGLLPKREYNFGSRPTEEEMKDFSTTRFFMMAEDVIKKYNQDKAFNLIKQNIDKWWD